MTKFELDLIEAIHGDGMAILTDRREEIERLTVEGRRCKNPFRCKGITEEVARLEREYKVIEKVFRRQPHNDGQNGKF